MKKQVFKNIELSRTIVKNNILKVWNNCSESHKFDWYKEANVFCEDLAIEYNIEKEIVIGILAALSPLKQWEINKRITIDFLNNGDCGQIKQFVKKASTILETAKNEDDILNILKGNKISSFYLNIKYYDKNNIVTIDRHALSIALGRKIKESDYAGMTTKQYLFFQECYIYAANILNINVLLLQSATWVRFREKDFSFKQL